MLAPDKRAVREARLHVRAFTELPRETQASAELVVSELVANSVLHARLRPDDLIEVTLTIDGHRLLIQVADSGGFSRGPRSKAGWGFKVLDAVCERWQAESGRVSASILIAGAGGRVSVGRQPGLPRLRGARN